MNGGNFVHDNTPVPKSDLVLPLFSLKGRTAIVSGGMYYVLPSRNYIPVPGYTSFNLLATYYFLSSPTRGYSICVLNMEANFADSRCRNWTCYRPCIR